MKLSKKFNYLRPLKVNDLIRVGNKKDGGYLIPAEAFWNIDGILSFGLGYNFTFEEHAYYMNNRLNIIVYDHSVNFFCFLTLFLKSIKRIFYFKSNLINILAQFNNLVNYVKFFLINKKIKHSSSKIVKKVSLPNEKNLKSIFCNLKEKKILLKIDIDGDEYQIIRQIKDFTKKVHILIIEFHNLDKKRKLFKDSVFFLKTFFNIVHIHGNNYCPLCKDNFPEVVELTFLNKEIYPLDKKNFRKSFPIKDLDFPSFQFRKDYIIQFH